MAQRLQKLNLIFNDLLYGKTPSGSLTSQGSLIHIPALIFYLPLPSASDVGSCELRLPFSISHPQDPSYEATPGENLTQIFMKKNLKSRSKFTPQRSELKPHLQGRILIFIVLQVLSPPPLQGLRLKVEREPRSKIKHPINRFLTIHISYQYSWTRLHPSNFFLNTILPILTKIWNRSLE